MSDLIDRQALLRQIDIDSEGEPGYYGDTWKFIDTIKRMPSALSTNLASLGTDCISRRQAIDALDEQIEQCNKSLSSFDISLKDAYAVKVERASLMAFRETLEYLPPAHPKIIRCRECKFASGDSRICMKFDHSPIGELDFCSFAERIEVTT